MPGVSGLLLGSGRATGKLPSGMALLGPSPTWAPAMTTGTAQRAFLFLAPSFSYPLMVSAAKAAPELPLGIWLRPDFP